MIYGLQTHIEGWMDPAVLRALPALGFQMARISAMECSVEKMLECVTDAEAAGLITLTTIADPARIALLPGRFVECRNEDDGDLSPQDYRRILEEFCAEAVKYDVKIVGGVGSNTDDDTLRWGNDVRGSRWPEGMWGVGWHTYGPYPHQGFRIRDYGTRRTEFEWLLAMCAGKPLIISEFGWANTTGTTEEDQAAAITREWTAIRDQLNPYAACLFQINDGANPTEREHRYGIRRLDGTWKPVAYTVPNSGTNVPNAGTGDDPVAKAELVISRKLSTAQPNGQFTAPYEGAVLSVQPNGDMETRPVGTVGVYELYTPEGNKAVYRPVPGVAYAFALVD